MEPGTEGGREARRGEWLERHHSRWSSPDRLLHDVVRRAGLEAESFERLVVGQANEVYSVTTAGGSDLILRIGWRPDPRFESEAAAIEAARRNEVPAPEVVAVGRLDEEDGPTGFILEERLPGVMLRDLVLAGTEVAAALEDLGEVLPRIHQIGVTGYGNLNPDLSANHPSCSQWFVDVFVERHLPKVLQAVAGISGAEALVSRATDELLGGRAALDACISRLAHGDVSPTNVLVESGRISGIVDWESAKGAPQANDLAWWTSGTVSLASPPDVGIVLRGYQRVMALDEGFWPVFRLCQLRIVMGRVAYAADVDDAELVGRSCEHLAALLAVLPD